MIRVFVNVAEKEQAKGLYDEEYNDHALKDRWTQVAERTRIDGKRTWEARDVGKRCGEAAA